MDSENIPDIDNLTIENLISHQKELNFTAKAWFIQKDIFNNIPYRVYDKHTPLSYAIHMKERSLFLKILIHGADVNCAIVPWEWLPMTYALKSDDSFFIKNLLKSPNLDIYKKVKNKNILNHLLSLTSLYEKVPESAIIKNITILINHIKKDKNFDFNDFFDNNIFIEITKYPNIAQLLLNKLPKSWIKQLINKEIDGKVHPAIHLFDLLSNHSTAIKKIITLLEPDKILKNGSTLLHYYIYDKNNSHRPPCVILSLLERGFSPELMNDKGQKPYDSLIEYKYFQDYLVAEKHTYLLKVLKTKEVTHSVKI